MIERYDDITYMDEKELRHVLIDILYATLNNVEDNDFIKQRITPATIVSVYKLAKNHDLSHVVANFVYKNKIDTDQEMQTKLQKEVYLSIYRNEQMKYAFGEICDAFDKAGISYIPLKGSVIRPYYPYENMRTSCDIDVLIHDDDVDTAISRLEANGYRCEERDFHDVSLYSPTNVHLELHFNILENMDSLDEILKDAWEYATTESGNRYVFSKDFFSFHMFAHMAYHFISGGCGIRSLLDIWVMEHKMKISYTCAKELLERAGLYKFASEMSKLAEQCFTSNDIDDSFEPVLSYIFKGGMYGCLENSVALDKSKDERSLAYIIRKIFPPYKNMIKTYPLLGNAPFLLPFYWIVRWIKLIFGETSKTVASKMKYSNKISKDETKDIRKVRSLLGL